MSCEMVSSRKIDYYVNDPYVTIIDIREEDKFLHSRIKGAIHYEYNKLMADINNIFRYGKFHMNSDDYSVIKTEYIFLL